MNFYVNKIMSQAVTINSKAMYNLIVHLRKSYRNYDKQKTSIEEIQLLTIYKYVTH